MPTAGMALWFRKTGQGGVKNYFVREEIIDGRFEGRGKTEGGGGKDGMSFQSASGPRGAENCVQGEGRTRIHFGGTDWRSGGGDETGRRGRGQKRKKEGLAVRSDELGVNGSERGNAWIHNRNLGGAGEGGNVRAVQAPRDGEE